MLAVTGVALLGACASPAETERSGSSPAKPVPAGQPDPVRDRALSAEADLLTRYDATLALPSVAADSGLTARLKAIRAEHSSHAAAIKEGYTPPAATTPSAPPATPAPSASAAPGSATSGSATSGSAPTTDGATTWSPPATTDAKTAVVTLAKAEQDAASARTSDILSADGETAMLLASIAASESGHAALLLGGTA
jgi:hypothetical protein